MQEVFAECGDGCYLETPFYASWGGHHVHFGSKIYANFNLTLIDDGHIYVGDRVLFGPTDSLTAKRSQERFALIKLLCRAARTPASSFLSAR